MKSSLLCLLLSASCGGSSTNGLLSSSNDSDENAVAAILITTTGGGALSTTAGLLTTADGSQRPPSLWLEHRREIEVAIARGNGAWIDDLASELAVPEGLVPRLGETLKRHREPLSARLQDEVMVDAWEKTLVEALCCDPWILPFAKNRWACPAPEAKQFACVP